MSSLNVFQLEINNKIKINFDEGDSLSDPELLLIKEFTHKFNFHNHVSSFKTDDKSKYMEK